MKLSIWNGVISIDYSTVGGMCPESTLKKKKKKLTEKTQKARNIDGCRSERRSRKARKNLNLLEQGLL